VVGVNEALNEQAIGGGDDDRCEVTCIIAADGPVHRVGDTCCDSDALAVVMAGELGAELPVEC
jgi:hypothetical protein